MCARRPLGLQHLGPLMDEHHMTGQVLLSMTKDDVHDLCGPYVLPREGPLPPNAVALGDRVLLIDALKYIQAKQATVDKERVIWHVRTPEGGPQYV